MPTKPLADEIAQEALNLSIRHGGTLQAAEAIGVSYSTLRHRVDVATRRGMTPKIEKDFSQSEAGHGVLSIPDLHCPFSHPDFLAFLSEAKHRLNPSRVVCLGDELDNHAISQYDPDPDGHSAGHELNEGRFQLRQLYPLFPDVRVCTSNHGVRPYKKAYRAGIPKAWIKGYAEVLDAPIGWRWDDKWEIDGVVYQHGEGLAGEGAHKKWAVANGKSTVIGHIHSHAGITYIKNDYGQMFGMNCGCLIDATKYAFAYGRTHPHKPVIGVGFVDNGHPFYFPMRLNDRGRWTGKW